MFELVTVTSKLLEVEPPLVKVTLGVVPVTVIAAPLFWQVKGFEPPKHPQHANSMRKKAIFPLGLDFVGMAHSTSIESILGIDCSGRGEFILSIRGAALAHVFL